MRVAGTCGSTERWRAVNSANEDVSEIPFDSA